MTYLRSTFRGSLVLFGVALGLIGTAGGASAQDAAPAPADDSAHVTVAPDEEATVGKASAQEDDAQIGDGLFIERPAPRPRPRQRAAVGPGAGSHPCSRSRSCRSGGGERWHRRSGRHGHGVGAGDPCTDPGDRGQRCPDRAVGDLVLGRRGGPGPHRCGFRRPRPPGRRAARPRGAADLHRPAPPHRLVIAMHQTSAAPSGAAIVAVLGSPDALQHLARTEPLVGRDPRPHPALRGERVGRRLLRRPLHAERRPTRRRSTATRSSAGRSWLRSRCAVPRLRLGTLVSSVTYRHPAVLANIAAAVDHISGGPARCSASAPAGRRTSTPPTGSSSAR